jgi:hypothetical protein
VKTKWLARLVLALLIGLASSSAWAQFPNNPTWTTVFVPPAPIEGLTGDNNGNFYVADRGSGGANCAVWQIDTNTNTVQQVGLITAACIPSGLAFDANNDLFITSPAGIYKLTPNAGSPTSGAALGSLYATGVPGANGVAFLGNNLFVTDGTENQGRVWKIASCATPPCPAVEFFRIQPRRNVTTLGGNVAPNPDPNINRPDGVGSERYTVPRHTIAPVNNLDRQGIVANGIAFSDNGKTVFVSDTSRGAIWAAKLKNNGDLDSNTGCDVTFHANTLCMDSLYVAHPLLEGVDGIALLRDQTILASVNERNAIVAINKQKEVKDLFQNAADQTTLLRNGRTGDPSAPMEFPTSPFASDRKFCTSGADSPRRDNNPNTGMGNGEGSKVICLDQDLKTKGLPLPVQ